MFSKRLDSSLHLVILITVYIVFYVTKQQKMKKSSMKMTKNWMESDSSDTIS